MRGSNDNGPYSQEVVHMDRIKSRGRRVLSLLSVMCLGAAVIAGNAFAAASTVTGIDYQTDFADPVVAEAKLPIVAAVSLLLLFASITVAFKLWKRMTGTGK